MIRKRTVISTILIFMLLAGALFVWAQYPQQSQEQFLVLYDETHSAEYINHSIRRFQRDGYFAVDVSISHPNVADPLPNRRGRFAQDPYWPREIVILYQRN